MLKSHEKFHSANGRRLILIADDELINRELQNVDTAIPVSMCFGIAFSDREDPHGDIFEDADEALTRAKAARAVSCVY